MTAAAERASVDVAVVCWNTAEAAVAAAKAYLASEGVEVTVTVVDNDSAPEQQRRLERELPSAARLVLSGENPGYGTAVNRALAGGRGELVCASNADVLPAPTALAELAAVALREPRAGMVGPSFDSADRYHAELPSAAAALGQIVAGGFRRRPVDSPPPGEVRRLGQPSGACFVVRRGVWEELGGFDEGFFLWFEDVDLAKRLVERGYSNLAVGSARAGHTRAAAFRQLDERSQQRIRIPSAGRYVRKHHPRLAPLARLIERPVTWLRTRG